MTDLISLGLAFMLGLAGLGCAFGIGKIGADAMKGISRNPEAASKIQTAMLISIAFVETIILYLIAIAFVKFN